MCVDPGICLALPYFNQVTGKQISISLGRIPGFGWQGSVCTLLTGVIAGSYPAFYLSSFRPIKVLKGGFRVSRLAAVPRKALVVLQFTVSVALIIGVLVVFPPGGILEKAARPGMTGKG
jgi:putative ABC transport system permease protein